MKYEREYLLRADLKEEIEIWINKVCWVDVKRLDIEILVEMIFYRLLHAGDLKDERPTYRLKGLPFGEKWMIDITGLNDKEAEEKIKTCMGDMLKQKDIKFVPKSMKMKVDADSPFKGKRI